MRFPKMSLNCYVKALSRVIFNVLTIGFPQSASADMSSPVIPHLLFLFLPLGFSCCPLQVRITLNEVLRFALTSLEFGKSLILDG